MRNRSARILVLYPVARSPGGEVVLKTIHGDAVTTLAASLDREQVGHLIALLGVAMGR